MNTLKLSIIFTLLITFSGCRELSDALNPDNSTQNNQLAVVKREQPNLSETDKIEIDPDSDDLTEELPTESDLTDIISSAAPPNENNSNNETESTVDQENTNSSESNTDQYEDKSKNASQLTFNSYGKLEVGMTVRDASEALGTELVGQPNADTECYYVTPKQDFEGLRFMVTNGTIARIEVENNSYSTDKGAKIGDTEERIKSLYEGVTVNPQKYDETKHVMEVYSEDEQYLIIFETDGKRVTEFRVGKAEEVGYVEGCS